MRLESMCIEKNVVCLEFVEKREKIIEKDIRFEKEDRSEEEIKFKLSKEEFEKLKKFLKRKENFVFEENNVENYEEENFVYEISENYIKIVLDDEESIDFVFYV